MNEMEPSVPLSDLVGGIVPLEANRAWLAQRIRELEDALAAWEATQ